MSRKGCLASIGFCVLLAAGVPARAQTPFYTGKTVSILMASGEGGAYAMYGQVAATYLRKFIPGNPTVIVQNMTGAGGIRAADYLANVAPKDGTTLAMLLDLAAVTQVLEPQAVKYDLSKFSVIGSFVTDNPVVVVRADTGVRDFTDLKGKSSIVVGASGKGSQTYIHPALLKEILGVNLKIVTGYRGSVDISLALERGEVQAQSATWLSWLARHPDWINRREVIPIVQVGLKKERDLPNVPLMLDLTTTAADRQVLELMSSGSQIGRALFAPPAVPTERVSVLRDAFETMVRDPEFLDAVAKRNLVIAATRGVEVHDIIQRVVSYAPSIIDRARTIAGVK
jgi:tripartite-type tricarboxylate transporter receptor subunit TctC